MGIVYDFKKARDDKYAPPRYIAPEEIEVPEFVREGVTDQRAKQRRRLLRVAVKLIDSDDIPLASESSEGEPLPKFDYPPTEKR